MKQFKGKRVLITGGASGIGKIMVRLLLEQEAKVIIWDVNQSKMDDWLMDEPTEEEVRNKMVNNELTNKAKQTFD